MDTFPCIMCGKEVAAMGGSQTIYNRADGELYACHNCRSDCDGGPGCYDSDVVRARLAEMSEDEKQRSRVPD